MSKLRVGVIDVIGKSASQTLNSRTMRANLASIMPQVVAVWCEEEGHDVFMAYHSGYLNMVEPLPDDLDLLFISSFTLGKGGGDLIHGEMAVSGGGSPFAPAGID